MARRVQTLVNQVTVPGYGFVSVAGTTVIVSDTDFQKIAPSFFSGSRPKLKDLGAIDAVPDQSGVFASQQDLATLAAQVTALSSDVATQKAMTASASQKATTAQQTATTADANATTATSTAADASSTADTAHSTATTAQTQAVSATATAAQAQDLATTAAQTAQTLSQRVTTLESKVQGLSGGLSALQGLVDAKENAGVAAGLVASHATATDPHSQYLTQARGDARYAALSHVHSIAEITALQAALDAKESAGAASAAMSAHASAANPHPQYCTITSATALQTAITALQAKSVIVQQPAALSVPAIALGGTTTLTVTWSSAMPNTSYGVIFMFDMGSSLIGSLTAQLVTGSRTTTGCQVLVKSTVLLSLGAAKLVVVGISNV